MEIKPEELRIGNLVDFDNEILRVESTSSSSKVVEASGARCDIRYLKPIPITEYWLLKFGFEKHGNFFWHSDQFSHIKVFPPGSPDNGYGIFVEGRLIGDVKYIHKLQNFWFEVIHHELMIS